MSGGDVPAPVRPSPPHPPTRGRSADRGCAQADPGAAAVAVTQEIDTGHDSMIVRARRAHERTVVRPPITRPWPPPRPAPPGRSLAGVIQTMPCVQHEAQMDFYGRRLATCASDWSVKVFAVSGDGAAHELQATLSE